MKHLRIGLSLVLLCALAAPLGAMRVKRLSLDEVRDRAAIVVVGEVIGSSTRLSASGEIVWTDYEFRVEETLAGTPTRGIRLVSIAGGEASGISIEHPGVPHLEIGGRYLLFLNEGTRFPAPTVGISQGMFRIHDVDVEGQRKQVLISADGETLEMQGDQIGRGLRARVENGMFVGAPDNHLAKQAQRVEIVAFNADGSPAPVERQIAQAPHQRGTFASLGEIRRYVRKEISSVTSQR